MQSQTNDIIAGLTSESPQAPIVQSIIFYNGDMLRFVRSKKSNKEEEEITFLEKITIDNYFEQAPNHNFSCCQITTSAENNEYRTFVGEGSWGGDGIICVIRKSDNQLVWFLFSDSSNPFSRVEIKDDMIIANSTLDKCWIIPIHSPQDLRIVS